jgi:hypothetical protein
MLRMGEPLRPDRKAVSGKYCIWVERMDGTDYRIPGDFNTEGGATAAAQAHVKQDQAKLIDRVLVYDEQGWFKYKMERR